MNTDKYSLRWNLVRDSIVYIPLATTSAIQLGESNGISPYDFETSLRRYIISREAEWITTLFLCDISEIENIFRVSVEL